MGSGDGARVAVLSPRMLELFMRSPSEWYESIDSSALTETSIQPAKVFHDKRRDTSTRKHTFICDLHCNGTVQILHQELVVNRPNAQPFLPNLARDL
jgi:hypothetical protein